MHGPGAEILALFSLGLTLAAAVVRPFGVGEAVIALPAGALLVATGVVPWRAAERSLQQIGPTVGFLAAILVFGHLCAEAGVFDYLGALAASASRGRASRLLALVIALAATVTAVLTLDATVVLVTPVVLAGTRRLALAPRPHLYACARVANSGSLLLPVSNLTNLLAFTASGLSFGRFAALMALPWLVACGGEWAALRTFFRFDLAAGGRHAAGRRAAPRAPRFALAVLLLTVLGFALASLAHLSPAWAALGGCVALFAAQRRRTWMRPGEAGWARVVREASPGFCVFVLALAVIVDGVTRHGLGAALRHALPSGTGLLALVTVVCLAGLLANAVNNLPATLALVPLVAGQPAWVLAVLLGVNIGPNATYPGSLATLLWRRVLPQSQRPRAGQFHLLGLLTVPVIAALATVALWLSLATVGL